MQSVQFNHNSIVMKYFDNKYLSFNWRNSPKTSEMEMDDGNYLLSPLYNPSLKTIRSVQPIILRFKQKKIMVYLNQL